MPHSSPVSPIRIAYLDDDPTCAEVLRHKLGDEGFSVYHFSKVEDLIDYVEKNGIDIFLIDVHMTMTSGFEAANKILAKPENLARPMLFISYDTSYPTIARCLREAGGEYVSKDTPAEEMRARIHSLMWKPNEYILKLGGLEVDVLNLKASSFGQPLDLTLKEFKILNLLLTRPEKCIHKRHLIGQVWSETNVSDKTLNSHMSNLRQKIAPSKVHIQIDREGLIEMYTSDQPQTV